jgi:ABC-2 type transport system permease protein
MTLIIGVCVLISTASIAFVVSSFVKHIRNIWSIASILTVLLTVLPPTFYPYTYLPKEALTILLIFPTTSAAVLEQGVFGISPMLWNMFYILIAETVILFLVARYFTIWRER